MLSSLNRWRVISRLPSTCGALVAAVRSALASAPNCRARATNTAGLASSARSIKPVSALSFSSCHQRESIASVRASSASPTARASTIGVKLVRVPVPAQLTRPPTLTASSAQTAPRPSTRRFMAATPARSAQRLTIGHHPVQQINQRLPLRLAETGEMGVHHVGQHGGNGVRHLLTALGQRNVDHASILARAFPPDQFFCLESIQHARHQAGVGLLFARQIIYP